ncbi:hypothetical protein MYX07_01330 [Patescibacteria group bacterium AH-259-L07]|nr:hypothetical protein [Patescibacteria group bacterium AH-259-L07]
MWHLLQESDENGSEREKLLQQAKEAYLEFAKANETSADKKKREDAAWAYRKAVFIIQGTPLATIGPLGFGEYLAKMYPRIHFDGDSADD